MKFKIGDSVRLNKNKKEFRYGRGPVSYEEVGTIERIDKDEYVVKFPSHSCWNGKEEELELVKYTYEDLKKSPIGTKITFEKGIFLLKDDEKYYENKEIWRNEEDLKKLKDNVNSFGKIIKIEEPTYKTVYEYKPEILDETEKRYLKQVIRPFRDRVEYIQKFTFSTGRAKIIIKTEKYKDTWLVCRLATF